MALVLTKRRPTDGAPNPYRTRWVVAGGVLWTIEADFLNAPWFVQPDLDVLIHAGAALTAPAELHTYISDDDRPVEIVTRLADARAYIAERIAAEDWPQHRDAWRQLAEARGVDLTNVPRES